MTKEVLFEEKQYLGRNPIMLVIRLILALFCFAAYFWSKNREMSGNLFLVLGIVIITLSIILIFLIHFRTKVFSNSLELEQYWSIRKVKLPLRNILNIEVIHYGSFLINNPVFNLHLRGTIHFYTNGDHALKITDKDGLYYIIGSQQADKLKDLLQKQISQGVN